MPSTEAPDPFAAWRDWVGQSERQWNAFLNEAMATDEFGQSMGQFMDVYLNLQRGMNEVMGRYLTALNLPSRSDVLSLANRLSDLEGRLSDIEDTLHELRTVIEGRGPGINGKVDEAPPKPPRTRKPKTD
jgi:polyhydroxyalkanoic acid synthase PhaR subunit